MNRRAEILLWGGSLILLAAVLYRAVIPDRPHIHPLSVLGLEIPSQPIATGQTVIAEKTWTPQEDVFVTGWQYDIGAPGAAPELFLLGDDVTIFIARGGQARANPAFVESGTGFLVKAAHPLKLRLRMTNTGPAGETRGASALVYFVPALGN